MSFIINVKSFLLSWDASNKFPCGVVHHHMNATARQIFGLDYSTNSTAHLSMGWMMSGMTPRPRPVTIQFLAVTATPGRALARPRPAPQQMRFIVKPEEEELVNLRLLSKNICWSAILIKWWCEKPGTMTEANACHNKVSTAAIATLLVSAPGSWWGVQCWRTLPMIIPEGLYLTLLHSFVICICKDVGWCHSICSAHPSIVKN